MKIHQTALMALTAAASARGFSIGTNTGRTAFLGKSVNRLLPRQKSLHPVASGLAMNLFTSNALGGGGIFAEKIDYESLDHPGPELAKFAQDGKTPAVSERDPNLSLATFAGGCFWGLELAFQRVPGVAYTAVGYTQGREEYPTYNQVCAGATGHTESVMVYYDPSECTYQQLLDTFFRRVNPTTVNGQGNDFGRQYRTGVYFHTAEQEADLRSYVAEEQKKYTKPIATEVKAAEPFWPAEKYHQQYLEKGGRSGSPQDASKGATTEIRCYG